MTINKLTHQTPVIWDWRVRLCHWLVASLVLFNQFNEGNHRAIHQYAGYAAVLLVFLRLLWGCTVAKGHANFQHLPSMHRLGSYLVQLIDLLRKRLLQPPQNHTPMAYEGHNPAGAAMAWLFWLLIMLLGLSGWMMQLDQFWGEEWLNEVHEFLANFLLICIPIHISAAVLMSWVHQRNLIKAMITGN